MNTQGRSMTRDGLCALFPSESIRALETMCRERDGFSRRCFRFLPAAVLPSLEKSCSNAALILTSLCCSHQGVVSVGWRAGCISERGARRARSGPGSPEQKRRTPLPPGADSTHAQELPIGTVLRLQSHPASHQSALAETLEAAGFVLSPTQFSHVLVRARAAPRPARAPASG